MLFENNVNPKAIQLLMGHSNIKITINIYNNIDYQNLRNIIDVIKF